LCPRLHIAEDVVINATVRGETRTWVRSHYGTRAYYRLAGLVVLLISNDDAAAAVTT